MLETLRIENYALIDELEIDFGAGFNVLTGETGAGKSIIVGALNLVLGARASSDVVRDGASRAKIDAVLRLPNPSRRLKQLLREAEITLEDGELMLSRTVGAEGRSRAYVCGSLVPIGTLAELGDELVDMHGQHEHQSLVRPERQVDLLDAYADAESQVASLSEQVAHLRQLDKAIAELETDDRERARRVEFLRFEVSEIAAANPVPGEEKGLQSRRNLIANAEKVHDLAAHAYASLYEAESAAAIDALDVALRDLDNLTEIDERFRSLSQQLEEARTALEEVSRELESLSQQVEFDPQELEDINQRITVLGDLKRKYGDSVEAVLAYRDDAAAEIDRFESRDKHLADMQRERQQFHEEATAAAQALSAKRKGAARKLTKKVTDALQELGMKGGEFKVHFETAELTSRGIDRIEFLLAANPGEKPKALRVVASGGEISRVMLALKAVFADADTIPTLIFDEIDAGVGGAVATKVAARLRQLAASHQVLCISHIAQIAATAQAHYHVSKTTKQDRTLTTLRRVEGQARVEEVARLLDGSLSDVSLKHARALLKAP